MEENSLTEAKEKVSRRGYMRYVGGIVVVAVVAAAGYGIYEATKPTPTPTPTPLPAPKYTFYYVPPNLMEDWHLACWQGGVQWAKQVGIEFITMDPNNDVARQISTCKTLAALKPDGVVMIPIDATAAEGADILGAAGVPIIVVDRDIVSDKIPLFVAFGSEAAGAATCDTIAAELKKKYGEERGKIIVSMGDLGAAPGYLRNRGFREALKKYPKIEVVHEHESPHFMVETSLERMRAGLEAVGKPDAIAVHYTGAGIAAMKCLEDKGWLKKIGEEGHVIVAGIDASPVVMDYVRKEYIEWLIDQPNLSYVPLGLYYLMKIKEVGMENAIPKEGTTVTAEDVPLGKMAPNLVNGVNPWTESIWAPAPVTYSAEFKHRNMATAGFHVTLETVDSTQIFGNVLPKWYPLIK